MERTLVNTLAFSLFFEERARSVFYLEFAFVKLNGSRNLGVTSLRLTQVRTLKERLEESKLCFPVRPQEIYI